MPDHTNSDKHVVCVENRGNEHTVCVRWAVKGHVSMLWDVLRLERSLSGPREMCCGQYHLLLHYLRAEREKCDSEEWHKTKKLPMSYQTLHQKWKKDFAGERKTRSFKRRIYPTWRFISVTTKVHFVQSENFIWQKILVSLNNIYIYFALKRWLSHSISRTPEEQFYMAKFPSRLFYASELVLQ